MGFRSQAFCGGSARKMPRVWTREECDLLRKTYPSTYVAVAKKLHLSRETVRQKTYRLGIPRGEYHEPSFKFWTVEECSLLRELYPTSMSREEIARQLGRSFRSVTNHAKALGLRRPPRTGSRPHQVHKKWTAEEVALLREIYPSTGGVEIAERLGRSKASVNVKAGVLGLSKDRTARRQQYLQSLRKRISALPACEECRPSDSAQDPRVHQHGKHIPMVAAEGAGIDPTSDGH